VQRTLTLITSVALTWATAAAAPVSERWAGPDADVTHPGTLQVVTGKTPRLVFDLSAIPDGAGIHHASLYCFTSKGAQPTDPVQIFVTVRLDGNDPVWKGKPLALEAPRYESFDATSAVQRWVKDRQANLGLAVARFENFEPERTYLHVVYDGKPRQVPEQVGGVAAAHHDGQTFIRWTEHASYRPPKDKWIWVTKFAHKGDKLADGPGDGAYDMPNHPAVTLRTLRDLQGYALRDKPDMAPHLQDIRPLKRIREVEPIRYRVYRHHERITPANVHQAERIAEVAPLTGLDQGVYQRHHGPEYRRQWEEPSSVIPTYCWDRGRHLSPGKTMYVHTPGKAGKAYYAVTMMRAGTENLASIGEGNSLARSVTEKPAPPKPVLQWIEAPYYSPDTVEGRWYRFWMAPPYTNVPGGSARVGLSVPRKLKQPAPLGIQGLSGSLNVRKALNHPSRTALGLHVEPQLHWLPTLFYNQGRGTLRSINECLVDYYPERYMLRMIRWVMNMYEVDRSKITGGLMHFGLRHPEIFTRMQMGRYTAAYDLRWAPGGPSMPRVLGPKGIKTTRGEDAWTMYSVGGYVNTYPDRDIPFLICISGTGKDGGHTCEFGWQDDPRGWAGLLKARQPFVAAWSCGLPRELGQAFKTIRWGVPIPAFSNGSLDNNPGNGDGADGDFYGCINGWLLWDDGDIVDEADRWETTVFVISSCPEDACTVDVTPRHCRAFKPAAGRTFAWTNTSLSDKREVQSGEVKADRWGRVTLRGVKVTRGRNRLRVTRK